MKSAHLKSRKKVRSIHRDSYKDMERFGVHSLVTASPIPARSDGFTLLELIIALTITAVIVVLIFSAFHIGIRAWEKGEKDVDRHQRYRIVLDLMKQQLSSTSLRKFKKDGKDLISLRGESGFVEFLTHIPIVPGDDLGLVYVKYEVDENEDGSRRLSFFERSYVFVGKDFTFDDIDPEEYHVLIPRAHSIEFEYYKVTSGEVEIEGEEKTGEWQPVWDATNEKNFPLAVRVGFTEKEDVHPIRIVIRIEEEEEM